ncbi:cysteine protease required for autophagy [Serpula lacrymans var. lacrymans S7.9]|uniref:Cysteine protease n=1 Tax=Serpula lacrymans var. lacrymans (strain S7.9) TaxID=578457 RepID=F8P0W3_SERL9|nr:cysteine protease required for autophagy [Serpula lacrymans var. lacrymans S7.9]EGO22797.1 cysteine protease required for autophagy [Serpula lacrymans var. lacrymans S7.9]
MATKHSRNTPSPSSPVPNHGSKLSKFLQKQGRDRSKSMTDPTAGGSSASIASSSSSSLVQHPSEPSSPKQSTNNNPRKTRFLGGKSRDDKSTPRSSHPDNNFDSEREDSFDEPPVIIEPADMPRTRARSERPLSTVSDIHPSVSLYSSSSSARIADLPTRLSGWLSHTFSTSSTDLSLPSLLSQSHLSSATASPKGKSSALLTAAKHGKGHLDRAMRFLMDSDSTPDKCSEPIWLLGVQHLGYEPPPPPVTPGRRSSVESRRSPSFRSSASSSQTVSELSQSQPPSAKHPGSNWPPVFYADFTSRIWLTYRSQFYPIRDSTLSALESEMAVASQGPLPSSPQPKRWNWPVGGEKGWTSDAGWGCMLRTGQSLLANALLHLHLGRDWRRPPYPVHTTDYATYVQIITWFFDTPSPQSPFSVHRMALAGKDLGKDVGQWFGPSTAAGAIKTLVHAFPEAGLGVSVASDGVIFQSDVYAASNAYIGSPRRHAKVSWGGRAVIVLIGIRLGLDGVNPIYYDTIKALYTFPQSVGIAGGRPSSSYYFMGSQADNLFYLDPHHARPAVPLRPAPPATEASSLMTRNRWERETTPDNVSDRRTNQRSPTSNHYRSPTSPSSVRTGSSTFSYHAPMSPSPLQHQLSTSSSVASSVSSQPYTHSQRWQNASLPASPEISSDMDVRELGWGDSEGAGEALDPMAEHYVNAYSPDQLRTFHCDRVRKMPMSGLDPSMLLGFLCKDENDWFDFRRRVNDLMHRHKTIFTVQDEPPTWPSDSDEFMGLESISEPDDMMEVDAEEGADEQYFDTRSPSTSPDASLKGGGKSSEVDTEEDPIGPITPGPSSTSFEEDKEGRAGVEGKGKRGSDRFGEDDEGGEGIDDDDDWIDPSVPTPVSPTHPPTAPPMEKTKSNGSASSTSSKGKSKKGKKSKKAAVPIMKPPTPPEHFPFPRSLEESFHGEGGAVEVRGDIERRMNNARARDGGRTQSGGVKGILTTDDGELV